MTIDKILKKIGLLHSINTETPTDIALVRTIIDKAPIDWSNKNLKILDQTCGRGTFLLVLAEKLESYGHSKKHIIENMLYGVDYSKVQSLIAAKALTLYYPGRVNIFNADSLEKDWNMKFDLIVGNPPFQSTEDGSKRKKMWVKFAEHAMNMSDVVALVTPTAWQKDNAKYFKSIGDSIKSHLISYGDAREYFNVGEDIGYWITDKNTTNPIQITDNNPCRPIYQKMLRTGPRWHYRDFQQPHSDIDKKIFPSSPEGDFNIPIYWTAKQIRYCRLEDIKYKGWKVIVNNSGHYFSESDPDKYSRIDNNMTVGLGAWGIKVNDDNEGKNVLSWVRSKLYRVVVSKMKTGGFNNPFIELEFLGTNKTWTDTEIYKHFKLTKEEIDYVEQNVE